MIAIRVCRESAAVCGLERVEFCCFDEVTAGIYEQLLNTPEQTGEQP